MTTYLARFRGALQTNGAMQSWLCMPKRKCACGQRTHAWVIQSRVINPYRGAVAIMATIWALIRCGLPVVELMCISKCAQTLC